MGRSHKHFYLAANKFILNNEQRKDSRGSSLKSMDFMILAILSSKPAIMTQKKKNDLSNVISSVKKNFVVGLNDV